jgi:hypothetical protein
MENEEIDRRKKNQHGLFHLHCTLNINNLNISILFKKNKIFLRQTIGIFYCFCIVIHHIVHYFNCINSCWMQTSLNISKLINKWSLKQYSIIWFFSSSSFEQTRLLLIKRRCDWEWLSSSLPCLNKESNALLWMKQNNDAKIYLIFESIFGSEWELWNWWDSCKICLRKILFFSLWWNISLTNLKWVLPGWLEFVILLILVVE